MTSFVSLLPRKRSSVPVRFHRLNCSSVVAIVAEIVETTIFLLAREVENKIYKGGIVWISECYLSKMSSHVILSYPPLVSYPDPALREGKGLVTIERFLGCAESSLPRACAKDSVLIVKYGEFAESVTNDCITSCDISRK